VTKRINSKDAISELLIKILTSPLDSVTLIFVSRMTSCSNQ